MTAFGPTLTTNRLMLRLPQAGDEHHLLAMIESEETRRFLGPNAVATLSDCFARNVRNAGSWALYGHGNFMVESRADGGFIGGCGLFRTHRGLGEDFDSCAEAGWTIRADRVGHGYAKEAMAAAHDWFDRTFGRQRTTCIIDPRNLASQSVARALGYVPYRPAQFEGDTVDLWERI